jgi:hypothetical protein
MAKRDVKAAVMADLCDAIVHVRRMRAGLVELGRGSNQVLCRKMAARIDKAAEELAAVAVDAPADYWLDMLREGVGSAEALALVGTMEDWKR